MWHKKPSVPVWDFDWSSRDPTCTFRRFGTCVVSRRWTMRSQLSTSVSISLLWQLPSSSWMCDLFGCSCRFSFTTDFSGASFSFSASRATFFADCGPVLTCPICIIVYRTFDGFERKSNVLVPTRNEPCVTRMFCSMSWGETSACTNCSCIKTFRTSRSKSKCVWKWLRTWHLLVSRSGVNTEWVCHVGANMTSGVCQDYTSYTYRSSRVPEICSKNLIWIT